MTRAEVTLAYDTTTSMWLASLTVNGIQQTSRAAPSIDGVLITLAASLGASLFERDRQVRELTFDSSHEVSAKAVGGVG